MVNRIQLMIAALLVALGLVAGCSAASASSGSYPDYGLMLNLSGTAIPGSGSAYAAGTTFYIANTTRSSMWTEIILAGGTGLTAGISVRFTCGYSASTDVDIPYTWTDQNAPTLAQDQAITGTAGATVWHLLQTGALTGAKAGCVVSARSANASAGGTGDQILVDVYGY